MVLIIYGVPLSQPVRAVLWACLIKVRLFSQGVLMPMQTCCTTIISIDIDNDYVDIIINYYTAILSCNCSDCRSSYK